MLLEWLLAIIILLVAAFPESGQALARTIFQAVERAHRAIRSDKMVFWIVTCVAMLAFSQVFAADLAWIAALDVATYVEIYIAVTVVSATVRLAAMRKQATTSARRLVLPLLAGLRSRRHRRQPRPKSGARRPPAGPESDPGFAFA